MTSGAVIAIAITLKELCTNATKLGAMSLHRRRLRERGLFGAEADAFSTYERGFDADEPEETRQDVS